MAVSLHDVRRIATGLPDVMEGQCHGTAAFYLRRKLLLRLRDNNETLVVRCPISRRANLIRSEPDIFFVTDHYRNFPAVLVTLLNVGKERLTEIIHDAWRGLASKSQIAATGQRARRDAEGR